LKARGRPVIKWMWSFNCNICRTAKAPSFSVGGFTFNVIAIYRLFCRGKKIQYSFSKKPSPQSLRHYLFRFSR
jgi:hypothetical protein